MNRLVLPSLFVSILFSGTVASVCAQGNASASLPQVASVTNTAANFSDTSGARVPLIKPLAPAEPLFVAETDNNAPADSGAAFSTMLALPMDSAEPDAAVPEPAPKPTPRFIYSERDDYRWQLGLGVSFERFRSSIYSASAVGTNTTLTYFLNDWLAAEGNVSTFFAPAIWSGEHIKLVNYGAGPKITWRRPRWEPWFHGLFGGTHALPQTAAGGKNGFSIQGGGGVDYRLAPRLSVRAEVDYVRTRLWGQWQNNGQAALGVVFHF